jgi:hypothetical protein
LEKSPEAPMRMKTAILISGMHREGIERMFFIGQMRDQESITATITRRGTPIDHFYVSLWHDLYFDDAAYNSQGIVESMFYISYMIVIIDAHISIQQKIIKTPLCFY